MTRRSLALHLLLLPLLLACASGAPRPRMSRADREIQRCMTTKRTVLVRVHDKSVDAGVYVRFGDLGGRTLVQGRTEVRCVSMPATGGVRLSAVTVGGGLKGPTWWRVEVPAGLACVDWALYPGVSGTEGLLLPCRSTPWADAMARDTLSPTAALVPVDEGWAAFTVCTTRPVSWFSSEINPADLPMTVAHEAEHRRTMAAFASCAGYKEWRNASVANRIEVEARAFCEGAKADLPRREHLLASVWFQAGIFRHYWPWSQEDAAAAIWRYCA